MDGLYDQALMDSDSPREEVIPRVLKMIFLLAAGGRVVVGSPQIISIGSTVMRTELGEVWCFARSTRAEFMQCAPDKELASRVGAPFYYELKFRIPELGIGL